ncbi:hypothetical protein B0A49_03223 [Cryomyces minteri]|uniref:Uncharacterized protein n=1 Tax=Cryomyces minteri TaxID=331657 RepID=A0A4U0XNF6_9PEZI|nr:hypothetical protein B0A49_03223 [Cryomyces minteri]
MPLSRVITNAVEVARRAHRPSPAFTLLVVNLLLFPLTATLFTLAYLRSLPHVRHSSKRSAQGRTRPGNYSSPKPLTIFITGVGTPQGLKLARSFYQNGHTVIGADFESAGLWSKSCARFSRALHTFYPLSPNSDLETWENYTREVLTIIRTKVSSDLFIQCSNVPNTRVDSHLKSLVERFTRSKVISTCAFGFPFHVAFEVSTDWMFSDWIEEAGLSLRAKRVHVVKSRAQVHKALGAAGRDAKFAIQLHSLSSKPQSDMLLPRSTMNETYHIIAGLNISEKNSWILRELLEGVEYGVDAVSVGGEVMGCVAYRVLSPRALPTHTNIHVTPEDSQSRVESIPLASALGRSLHHFTCEMALHEALTAHFSLRFIVAEKLTSRGTEQIIYPTSCVPRPSTAMALLSPEDGVRRNQAYSMAHRKTGASVEPRMIENHVTDDRAADPFTKTKAYNVQHEFSELVVGRLRSPLLDLVKGIFQFCYLLLSPEWKEIRFDVWDPVPSFWEWQVRWPLQLLAEMKDEMEREKK